MWVVSRTSHSSILTTTIWNQMTKHFISLIRAEQFYSPQAALQIHQSTATLERVPTDYGFEIPSFQLLEPGIEEIFSTILGDNIMLDKDTSGSIRTQFNTIHFESFESLDDWCFAVALEPTTFNTYFHLSGAQSALQGYQFSYRNLLEWDYNTNILLEPGQGIFFRPWLFHSFSNGSILYFKIKSEKSLIEDKRRILVMGHPGSGKTTFAKLLSSKLNATHLDSTEIRRQYDDTDYTFKGRLNQAQRLKKLSTVSSKPVVIIDAISPTTSFRDYIKPHKVIWMDTIQSSKYEDNDIMFEPPGDSIRIRDWDYEIDDIINQL